MSDRHRVPSTFVLVHSPSVGPSTWQPVAAEFSRRGRRVVVPDLRQMTEGPPPYWPAVCDAVRTVLGEQDGDLVLVPHSNAGLFVPVLVEALGERVAGCVFVDASLPAAGESSAVAPPDWLAVLRAKVAEDGRLPVWTQWFDEADVAPMFPDPQVRAVIEAEQPRLPLSYYEQRIPTPPGWNERPCAYVWFGPPYDEPAAEAAGRGWPVARVPGQHLHMIVDPAPVTDAILDVSPG